MWCTPSSASESTIALITAASAGVVPPSPRRHIDPLMFGFIMDRGAPPHLLGLDEVPCIVLAHLTPAQRRAYVVADNKLALYAGWDLEVLSLEIGELGEAGQPHRL